ncbi:uncharacterized protein LOC131572746 [Poecile atricapillus]|uniref:uncharacterized protein LOC131572746 n=1 Tax=Poecile atricapillus TaxID=48891 RepID=UPI002739CD3E|nr:uncharacterized protein LOC131572746 [Poecile atricapillus]
MTVQPRNQMGFWGTVTAKVDEVSGCNSGHSPLDGEDGSSGSAGAVVVVTPDAVVGSSGQEPGTVSGDSLRWDAASEAAPPDGYQAFPALQDAVQRTHQPVSWKALADLREKVMQALRGLVGGVLVPYDIQNIGCVLFQPVEYGIFEGLWTEIACQVVQQNTALGQRDPRWVISSDVLLGKDGFADVNRQVGLEPLVLEQCKETGMATLVRALELAAPKEIFVTIVQRADKSFLRFANRLTASVEQQVRDSVAKQLMLKTLAKTNCNAECWRIISAFPGDPLLTQMARACVEAGVDAEGAPTVAAVLWPTWVKPQGGQQQRGTAQASKKKKKKSQGALTPLYYCAWCGRANHGADVCRMMVHVNGKSLSGSGNGKLSTTGRHAQIQASLHTPEPMEVCSAGS